METDGLIHPFALVSEDSAVGAGTRVWQFASVIRRATVGVDCTVGSNAMIDGSVLGDRCLIGHGAFICPGVVISSEVFVGPYVMFSNDRWPRVSKDGFPMQELLDGKLKLIKIERRASIGIGAIVLSGVTIGHDSMVSAGAVVERSIPPCSLLSRDGRISAIDPDRMERMRAERRVLPMGA